LAGKDPEVFVLDLLLDAGGHVGVAWFNMAEDDLRTVLKYPLTMVASDGVGTEPSKYAAERPHPRSYGTFPRVLAKYVREEKLLSLEEAIFKMTGLPAARLGLTDRGVLQEGAYADIVVFDFGIIEDLGGLPEPASVGIRGLPPLGERAVRRPRRRVHGNPRGARLATGVAYFPVGRSKRNIASGVARTYHRFAHAPDVVGDEVVHDAFGL
jgi:N-acyl-D-aspartate/D-glutamate deacylase